MKEFVLALSAIATPHHQWQAKAPEPAPIVFATSTENDHGYVEAPSRVSDRLAVIPGRGGNKCGVVASAGRVFNPFATPRGSVNQQPHCRQD